MCLYDAEFYKLISRYHQKLIGNDFGQSYYSNYRIYYTYIFFYFTARYGATATYRPGSRAQHIH